MIVAPYTFQCKELLFVLARMHPSREVSEQGTVLEAAGQLANSLSREVVIVDDQELLVVLDDPVEAVAVAQSHSLRVTQCVASPLALELLRESGEPARAMWGWLKRQLMIQVDPVGIVRLGKLRRERLPDGVDIVPDGPGVWVWVAMPEERVVFVDRAHAIGRAAIVPFRETWAVEDRGSVAGTYVDDRLCRSRCLVPGMTIRIDDIMLVILSVR